MQSKITLLETQIQTLNDELSLKTQTPHHTHAVPDLTKSEMVIERCENYIKKQSKQDAPAISVASSLVGVLKRSEVGGTNSLTSFKMAPVVRNSTQSVDYRQTLSATPNRAHLRPQELEIEEQVSLPQNIFYDC